MHVAWITQYWLYCECPSVLTPHQLARAYVLGYSGRSAAAVNSLAYLRLLSLSANCGS